MAASAATPPTPARGRQDLPNWDTWVNTTPHEVKIFDESGAKELCCIPPSKEYGLRLKESAASGITMVIPESGIRLRPAPVYEGFDGKFPGDGVPIIVSMPVAQQMHSLMPERKWVLTPDSSPDSAVRDSKGVIVGVKAVRLWQ